MTDGKRKSTIILRIATIICCAVMISIQPLQIMLTHFKTRYLDQGFFALETGDVDQWTLDRIESFIEALDLRFLVLGTSQSWGEGLSNREMAYPNFIPGAVTNLASKDTAPSYPALCMQNMIGDSVFDVIIIEYLEYATEGLSLLCRRLRERFPSSLIIMVWLFEPIWITTDDGQDKDIKSWAQARGFETMNIEAAEAFYDSDLNWKMKDMKEKKDIFYNITEEISASSLLKESDLKEQYTTDEIKQLLFQHFADYGPDWKHLNEKGHKDLKRGIYELIIHKDAKQIVEVNQWSGNVQCDNWYETGNASLWHDDNLVMRKFDDIHYSLEVPSEGGSLRIVNPYETPCEMHLTYLASSKESYYPRVKISTTKEIEIEPDAEEYYYIGETVIVPVTIPLGKYDTGEYAVLIKPQEAAENDFGVTSIVCAPPGHSLPENFGGFPIEVPSTTAS